MRKNSERVGVEGVKVCPMIKVTVLFEKKQKQTAITAKRREMAIWLLFDTDRKSYIENQPAPLYLTLPFYVLKLLRL